MVGVIITKLCNSLSLYGECFTYDILGSPFVWCVFYLRSFEFSLSLCRVGVLLTKFSLFLFVWWVFYLRNFVCVPSSLWWVIYLRNGCVFLSLSMMSVLFTKFCVSLSPFVHVGVLLIRCCVSLSVHGACFTFKNLYVCVCMSLSVRLVFYLHNFVCVSLSTLCVFLVFYKRNFLCLSFLYGGCFTHEILCWYQSVWRLFYLQNFVSVSLSAWSAFTYEVVSVCLPLCIW